MWSILRSSLLQINVTDAWVSLSSLRDFSPVKNESSPLHPCPSVYSMIGYFREVDSSDCLDVQSPQTPNKLVFWAMIRLDVTFWYGQTVYSHRSSKIEWQDPSKKLKFIVPENGSGMRAWEFCGEEVTTTESVDHLSMPSTIREFGLLEALHSWTKQTIVKKQIHRRMGDMIRCRDMIAVEIVGCCFWLVFKATSKKQPVEMASCSRLFAIDSVLHRQSNGR